MATAKQIAANQRNSLHSTGPKTAEGKAISRRNAITHGHAGHLNNDEKWHGVREERMQSWLSEIRATGPMTGYHYEKLIEASVRLDRVQEDIEGAYRKLASKARTSWHDDRMLEVEELALKLRQTPGFVVAKLKTSLHGCEWLRFSYRGHLWRCRFDDWRCYHQPYGELSRHDDGNFAVYVVPRF